MMSEKELRSYFIKFKKEKKMHVNRISMLENKFDECLKVNTANSLLIQRELDNERLKLEKTKTLISFVEYILEQ